MKKFEQVTSNDHQISLAGGLKSDVQRGTVPGLMSRQELWACTVRSNDHGLWSHVEPLPTRLND